VPPPPGVRRDRLEPAAIRSAGSVTQIDGPGNDEPTDEWPVQRTVPAATAPQGPDPTAAPGAGDAGRTPPAEPTGRAVPAPGPDGEVLPGGDREDPAPSWDEIAERYGATVYTMAYRLTGDRDEARDLAQDVFVRVYRNLDRYRPGTFEGWLYRITKNLFLDRMRRRSRVRVEPLPEEEWRQPSDVTPGPADRIEAGMLRGDLERALQDLPPLFRTAVVLCDVQGMSYEEVAQATGWPLGTVRSRIHRGRRLLRRRLAGGGRG
jgi:RNA polymerase sigma-70 factor, ECF subfamily